MDGEAPNRRRRPARASTIGASWGHPVTGRPARLVTRTCRATRNVVGHDIHEPGLLRCENAWSRRSPLVAEFVRSPHSARRTLLPDAFHGARRRRARNGRGAGSDKGVAGHDQPCAVVSVLRPRIGRSRALSRPWSDSTRLLPYCSMSWKAPGTQLVDRRPGRPAPGR